MFLHKDAGEMGVAGVRTIVEDSIPDLHINLVVLLQIQQAGHWQANPAGVIAFAVGSGDGLASSVEHGRSAVNVALVDDASKWEEERAADGRCEHAIGRVHRTTCVDWFHVEYQGIGFTEGIERFNPLHKELSGRRFHVD